MSRHSARGLFHVIGFRSLSLKSKGFIVIVALGNLGALIPMGTSTPQYGETWFPLIFAGLGLSLALFSLARTTSRRLMVTRAAVGGAVLVLGFTSTYFLIGPHNFTEPMTRVDALYFTLGTLTTAGTGNLSPTTNAARAFVSLQFIVDIIYAVFVLGIVLSRLATPRMSPQSTRQAGR